MAMAPLNALLRESQRRHCGRRSQCLQSRDEFCLGAATTPATLTAVLVFLPPAAQCTATTARVKRSGLVKHIGLSNFTIAMLDNAWRLTTEPIAAQHLEFHPYLAADKIVAAIRARGMAPLAYCPVALGRVIGDPVIEAIGRAHGKSAAQIALRWIVQQPDFIAIPKTAKVERLSENLAIFDFALADAEMAQMNALKRPGSRLVNEPQWVPEWDD